MTLTKERFKQYLLRDKQFLKEIYASQSPFNTKRLLMFANDEKLDTIIKLFYFLSSGQIKMRKSHFDSFSKAQIVYLKKHFEKKASVFRTLKLDRADKLKIIMKLLPIMSKLVYPLFNSAKQ